MISYGYIQFYTNLQRLRSFFRRRFYGIKDISYFMFIELQIATNDYALLSKFFDLGYIWYLRISDFD